MFARNFYDLGDDLKLAEYIVQNRYLDQLWTYSAIRHLEVVSLQKVLSQLMVHASLTCHDA